MAHTHKEPEKVAETPLSEPESYVHPLPALSTIVITAHRHRPPVPIEVRPGDAGRLPGLAQLPTDILPLIFVPLCSFDVGAIARVRLTCRSWRTFVARLPIVVTFPKRMRFDWRKAIAAMREQVPRLTGVRGWYEPDLRPLVPIASQLTTLGVMCRDWSQLGAYLAERGAGLTTLSIDSAPQWHYRRTPATLASLTSLRSLALKGSVAKPPVCEWSFPPSLTALSLRRYAVTCAPLPNLRFLKVTHLHARYETFIKRLLSGCPSLRKVTLRSFNSYPGTDSVACPSVEVVSVRDCHWRLEHIVSHFPNVRCLTLSLTHPPASPVGELRRLETLVLDDTAAPVSWIAENVRTQARADGIGADRAADRVPPGTTAGDRTAEAAGSVAHVAR